jgi:hypothetical protein
MSFDPRDPPDPYDDRDRGYREGAPRPADPLAPRDPYDYRDPLDATAKTGPNAEARGRVTGPAIFLIIIGALNLLSGLGGISMGLICYVLPPDMIEAQMKQQNPQQAAQIKAQGMDMKQLVTIEGHFWMAGGVGGFILGIPILLGGIGMLRLRWYGLAALGSVLAMISPGGCCALGMAAGIWGLVVLFNPEVRSAFQ